MTTDATVPFWELPLETEVRWGHTQSTTTRFVSCAHWRYTFAAASPAHPSQNVSHRNVKTYLCLWIRTPGNRECGLKAKLRLPAPTTSRSTVSVGVSPMPAADRSLGRSTGVRFPSARPGREEVAHLMPSGRNLWSGRAIAARLCNDQIDRTKQGRSIVSPTGCTSIPRFERWPLGQQSRTRFFPGAQGTRVTRRRSNAVVCMGQAVPLGATRVIKEVIATSPSSRGRSVRACF